MDTPELQPSPPPTLGGRYRLGRELGRGGMATVYRAEDVRHRRAVAVKVLHPELAGGISAERFLREIEIVAQLLHPHILTLIDSGEDGGSLYYVMPYVEGESLRARLDREGELPVDEGVRILREVADALAHAHRRGIVHRDVKPENVLLTGQHALVADFGIAKALDTARDAAGGTLEATLTGVGIVLGTPAYMAPEQAAGDPHADGRADLYAVGVLAYEMLAGAPPFTGPTAQHVMAAHLTRDPEPLARRRPTLPPGLEAIVMRCLAKRPADRWRDGDELMRRLDAVLLPAAAAGADGARRAIATRAFRLTEDVCRQLDRATLDPRVIGGELQYHDNETASPVLVCFVHGTGYDARQFDPMLARTSYRALAPTLHGFEPAARRRVALSLDDHLVLLRAFLRDAVARLRPETVVLVGFSSAGDAVLRLLAADDDGALPRIDGAVALGANLSLETCFVTRLFVRMSGGDPARVLADLRSLGTSAESLDEWLNIHEYLVATLRKFHGDLAPLLRFSADIVQPFAAAGDTNPFADWYRRASGRVRVLRCVFEDTDEIDRPLRQLRLRNLDAGVLGPHHREDAIVVDPGTDHFDLVDPERMLRHVDEVVAALRAGGARTATA